MADFLRAIPNWCDSSFCGMPDILGVATGSPSFFVRKCSCRLFRLSIGVSMVYYLTQVSLRLRHPCDGPGAAMALALTWPGSSRLACKCR